MNDTFDLRELLADELIQRHESGYDVGRLGSQINDALGDPDVAAADIGILYDALDDTRLRAGWPFEEPSELSDILARLPELPARPRPAQAAYADRVHGAWLGRCAGCNLGKPVEAYGWNRDKVHRYLELADALPLRDYIPVLSPMPDEFTLNPSWQVAARGRVDAMARDDDTDYTMLGLHVLEKYGADFTSADVGREWLRLLPFGSVFTAERVAYRNLINLLDPPASATFRNPYREWIGALIRGDIFGYVSPGDPFAAARLAYQDATLSHTGNGIYGEMWAAALVGAAFSSSSASEALDVALAVVPGRSRLAAALADMLALYRRGAS
jgi:ADP-ribosylglycohydrolase